MKPLIIFLKNMSKNINKLLKEIIDSTNKNKSSHWEKNFKINKNFSKAESLLGLGVYGEKNVINHLFSDILSSLIFGNKFKKLKTFANFKKIFFKCNRLIECDAIRHIFTFDYLSHLSNIKNICIIGDGKLNSVIGSITTFPNAKIFSVNLIETFLNDLSVNKKMKLIGEKNIQLIAKKNDQINNNSKLILVPANLKSFLRNKNIDLFINISSFQEMNLEEINEYFDIIKASKTYLYTCNRLSKTLPDRSVINFNKYPWGNNGKIILSEECPWHKYFYNYSPPFVHKYDGKHMHRLIKY